VSLHDHPFYQQIHNGGHDPQDDDDKGYKIILNKVSISIFASSSILPTNSKGGHGPYNDNDKGHKI